MCATISRPLCPESSPVMFGFDIQYRRSGNFRCKNIFVVCVNHENKKHEVYFTTNNYYSQHTFAHMVSQQS